MSSINKMDSAAHTDLMPLCVDLDGTLVRTDLLHESVFALLRQNAFDVFRLPMWLARGKANMKHEIASRVGIDATNLPYNQPFLDYLRSQHASGRRLILTTASDIRLARAVADHLGLFVEVIASDGRTNVAGEIKVKKLVERFGDGEFDYAGNSHVDRAVWRHAREAILVNPDRGVQDSLPDGTRVGEVIDDREAQLPAYVRAMRPQQWLKNVLLFLPLLLAHQLLDMGQVANVLIAFLSFSLCASSVYLLNDLVDLAADRSHPSKRERPFASGSIPILGGAVLIPVLLLGSAAASLLLSAEFQLTLLGYFLITLAYSLRLKRIAIMDVIVLAGLYTMRIIAGAAAISVAPSFWILSFSMFLFLSLALIKRFTELSRVQGTDIVKGRGYRPVDLETLSQFGISSAFVAILVLALYIDSAAVGGLYRYPPVLWGLCPIALYVVGRIWWLARRGEVDEDPVVFLARDRRSQAFIALGAITLWLAA